MQLPISNRKGIPFFYPKSDIEFQRDDYELYHEMVVRQSALHLADPLWGGYPFQAIFDFTEKHYPNVTDIDIVELGCGVGRWIATLAKRFPTSTCWGIDYSYQMLKQAHRFWVEEKAIVLDLKDRGLDQQTIKGESLTNLQFGLAKAEELPFVDSSQDLVVHSFLLDRLENLTKALEEMYRVLKPKGKLMVVSPLNFQKAAHWKMYFPPGQLSDILKEMGFVLLDWEESMMFEEPLDKRGNVIRWNCLGFVAEKR